MEQTRTYTAFLGPSLVASGPLDSVLPVLKERFDRDAGEIVLIFNDQSGKQVDFDLRGTIEDVLARVSPPARVGPGRPKLGVISREISLLPRHWDWLEEQPNGASAALRRLVDQARKRDSGAQRARMALGRFLSVMAGNRPGWEEATRALYAGNRTAFDEQIRDWPHDIRSYIQTHEEDAFREE